MDQVKLTYDEATQKQLLAKIIPQIVADNPVMVVYYPDNIYAENRDLKGYVPGPFTNFDDMMNVDI